MLKGRDTAERVPLEMIFGDARLCENIHFNQIIINLLLFEGEPDNPHINTPCGAIENHRFLGFHNIAPGAYDMSPPFDNLTPAIVHDPS